MLVKRASEIIRQAKFLAQCENSDFLDDFTTTNIINEVYEEIYQDIITHTKNYLCTLDFNGEVLLPCDCYQIDSVINKNTGRTIDKAPKAQSINGCYTIENQCLKVIGAGNEEYTLKYYPEPVTITAMNEEDNTKELDLSVPGSESGSTYQIDEVEKIRDDYFIFKSGATYYKYDFETNEITEMTNNPWNADPIVWKGILITTKRGNAQFPTLTSIKFNNVEHIDDFNKIPNPYIDFSIFPEEHRPEYENNPMYKYKQPMYIMADEENMYVTFVSVSSAPNVGGVYETYQINEDESYEIVASSLNKDPIPVGYNKLESGMGFITYTLSDGNATASFIPWMPDTLLDFPVNIYYTVMEERIALLLASIVGVENEYLKNGYKERIEQQYYNTLKHDDYSPCRVRNVIPRGRYL